MMEALIQVYRMTELMAMTRIEVIKKLGQLINHQYGSNIAEDMVGELVSLLDDERHESGERSSFISGATHFAAWLVNNSKGQFLTEEKISEWVSQAIKDSDNKAGA